MREDSLLRFVFRLVQKLLVAPTSSLRGYQVKGSYYIYGGSREGIVFEQSQHSGTVEHCDGFGHFTQRAKIKDKNNVRTPR